MPFLSLDLRHGIRRLVKDPSFTLAAILTFAAGIGAAITVFTVFSAALLRPLPFPNAERIVYFEPRSTGAGTHQPDVIGGADYLEIRERSRTLRHVAALEGSGTEIVGQYVMKTPAGPIFLPSGNVAWNFFDVFGVRPLLGRKFEPRDEESELPRVVILGERVWRDRFSSDRSVIGRIVELDGMPLEIVGVMPAAFQFPPRAEIWIPTSAAYLRRIGRNVVRAVQPVALLSEGATIESAQAEMDGIASDLASRFPVTNTGRGIHLLPIREALAGELRAPLAVLLLSTVVLVLIASVNVANLQLARASARAREFAIRAALGEGQSRLIRSILTDGVLLAVAGAVTGACLGAVALRALPHLWTGAADLPSASYFDWRVLAGSAAFIAMATLLSGVAPAFFASRISLASALRDGSAGASARTRTRASLAIAEVALAVMLLVCAGLMMESFRRLSAVDHGFRDPARVSTMLLTFPPASYPTPASRQAAQTEILRRVSQLAGVESAGLTYELPMRGVTMTAEFQLESQTDGAWRSTDVQWVSPGALAALGTPLLRGRWFRDEEALRSPSPVVVVNQEFARVHFGGRDPVGARLRFQTGPGPLEQEIIGVTGNLQHRSLDHAVSPTVYRPTMRMQWCYLVVRGRTGASLRAAISREVAAAAADQPTSAIPALSEVIDGSIAGQRSRSELITVFGAVALLLASIGVYGVVAYSVSQRSRDIAIRLAIGADPGDVVRMVVKQGALLSGIGLAAGLLLARMAAQAIRPLLFGVSAGNIAIYGAAGAVLMIVVVAACLAPAIRAARLDPVAVLKQQ